MIVQRFVLIEVPSRTTAQRYYQYVVEYSDSNTKQLMINELHSASSLPHSAIAFRLSVIYLAPMAQRTRSRLIDRGRRGRYLLLSSLLLRKKERLAGASVALFHPPISASMIQFPSPGGLQSPTLASPAEANRSRQGLWVLSGHTRRGRALERQLLIGPTSFTEIAIHLSKGPR